jgi:hypothetical protein
MQNQSQRLPTPGSKDMPLKTPMGLRRIRIGNEEYLWIEESEGPKKEQVQHEYYYPENAIYQADAEGPKSHAAGGNGHIINGQGGGRYREHGVSDKALCGRNETENEEGDGSGCRIF